MPYVPGCHYDIFVSYASENNRDGWVSQFVKRLGWELEEQLGRRRLSSDQSIYFDQRELRAGDNFPEGLKNAARDSALLIPVLSPGYIDSPWCEQELIAFQTWLPEGAALPDCLSPVQIRPPDSFPNELIPDRTNVFSFQENNRPVPTGSPDWESRLNRFADQVAQKLQTLRLRHKAVYVGRSPPPYVPLRERVRTNLQSSSFRWTYDLKELPAIAVHFAGGNDSDEADYERLNAIERTAARVTTFVFVPFGATLSDLEQFWRDDAKIGGKPIKDATRWIEQKHEEELLHILEGELTRLALPPPAAAEVVLACNAVDETMAQRLKSQIAMTECRVSLTGVHSAATSMERMRRWATEAGKARALVYCWGSDKDYLARLEQLANARERPRLDCWYLLEPDIDNKRSQRPDALASPAELNAFLAQVCGTAARPPA